MHRLWILLALTLSFSTSASVLLPGDGPYAKFREGDSRYIFEERAQKFIHDLVAYNKAIHQMYQKSYGWTLDEDSDVVLTSAAQQIPNAYATVIPNVKTVWFPSGALMLEEMAQSSWLLALATHETAHLYQLNAKGPVSAAFKKFLKNSPVAQILGLPIFIHPNVLTPTFLLEGNATFVESLFNWGGRLHSGEKRALVYAQIKAGSIDPNRLINHQFKFPFGEEMYLQGGYFFAHLARKHGLAKANQFFVAQGDHFINPLILNETFRRHFGDSYPQEIREYVRETERLAQNQKSTEGRPLASAVGAGPINQNTIAIWLLMTDGVQTPEMIIYDRATKQISREKLDLPLGKAFKTDGLWKSAAPIQHDLRHIEYSLYGEGLALDPNFRGQIVTDQRANKTVALDASNSWLDPQLLVNGSFYDVAHSSAVLDSAGNVYYFRQNGEERILYKNREPQFKYKGFYGKPMEVGLKGEIFFIANTPYGSSLYQFKNNEISRVLSSDTITEARQIGESEFLVVEVTDKGFDLKIAARSDQAQLPTIYDYGLPQLNFVAERAVSQEEVESQTRSYNGLTSMRWSAVDLFTTFSSQGLRTSVDARFTDPLEWHLFGLGYDYYATDEDDVRVAYSYTRYIPKILTAYEYRRRLDISDRPYFENRAYLGLGIPLLKWRRWSMELTELATYQTEDYRFIPRYETWGLISLLSLGYSQSPSLGMFPWREFLLTYKNNLESLPNRWTRETDTSLVTINGTYGLIDQLYVRTKLAAAWSNRREVGVEYMPSTSLGDTRIDRYVGEEIFFGKEIQQARVEITKVLNLGAYSTRWPISLRRLAPVIGGQVIQLDRKYNIPHEDKIYEWGYGADIELLMAHKAPVIIRNFLGFDSLRKEPEYSASLRTGFSF